MKRRPDITYMDIAPENIKDYVNLPDEECHKLEAIFFNGEKRYDIKIWMKEGKRYDKSTDDQNPC